MLQLDIPKFRTQFPEFADSVKYPTQMIEFWAGLAEAQVRQSVWKTQWTMGVSLYTAHEITIAAQAALTGKLGGTPGTFGGIANTKTVGSVTVGYDSQSTSEKDAGWYNKTTYGQQFYRLARLFGAGGIQL
jgi:hypothetical protein